MIPARNRFKGVDRRGEDAGLCEELPPIENENEGPDSRTGEIPGSMSSRESGAALQSTAAPPKSAGYRALRSLAGSLPGTQFLGLLRYEPGKGGQPATLAPVSVIRNDHGRWITSAAQDLFDPQLTVRLAATQAVEGAVPSSPMLHLPGTLVIFCREEQVRVRGVVVVMPDPYRRGADERPPAGFLDLLTTLALLALEVESASAELLHTSQVAADEVHARETFVSFAAHELRSPLTALKGFAQLLVRQSRKTPLPESMQRSVQAIEQQSSRMSEMLGEMLDSTRILRGSLELIPGAMDLAQVVRQVVERRRRLFPEYNFALFGADLPISGYWDSGRVEQILRDLLDNAAHHSTAGDTIVVTVTREPRQILVSVRDEGCGIEEADQPLIFGHLYRTADSERRNLSGLGLGLFVSQYLAKRLGGDLWLESSSTTLPTGSEFRFSLPARSTDSAGASEEGDRVH